MKEEVERMEGLLWEEMEDVNDMDEWCKKVLLRSGYDGKLKRLYVRESEKVRRLDELFN